MRKPYALLSLALFATAAAPLVACKKPAPAPPSSVAPVAATPAASGSAPAASASAPTPDAGALAPETRVVVSFDIPTPPAASAAPPPSFALTPVRGKRLGAPPSAFSPDGKLLAKCMSGTCDI